MKTLIKAFEFLFTYYHVYKLNLQNSSPKQLNLPEGFLFKKLNDKDGYLFCKLTIPENYLTICLDRLKEKNILTFAIIDIKNDCLAAYSCINKNDEYYLSVLNKKINLKKSNSYFFEDDNTIEEYRKMGLSSYIMNERIKYSISHKKNSFGFVHPSNLASVKTLQKFNFKRTMDFPIAIRKEAITYIRNKFL